MGTVMSEAVTPRRIFCVVTQNGSSGIQILKVAVEREHTSVKG
jgi:hypothetical protein